MKTVFMNFPNFGDIKIEGVYKKGKKGNTSRLLISEIKSNITYIIWLEPHPIFGQRIEFTEVKIINKNQLKQQNYNYYLDISVNEDDYFDDMILEFINSDPMVPSTINSMQHTKYSLSSKYPIYL